MENKEAQEVAEIMYPIYSTGGAMEMLSRHQLDNSFRQEGFIAGAKWQEQRMYSEEDLRQSFIEAFDYISYSEEPRIKSFERWFEQFKQYYNEHRI